MFAETKYRRDIQVLRGLAVLAVVLFHADESYFPLGYLGVDVFLVISGFVVSPLILRIFDKQSLDIGGGGGRLSNLRYFYQRRFYRLAPALAVALIFSLVVVFLIGPSIDHQRFARQGIATLLLLGNLGAFRYSGDYFSPNPNPLVHTWSLSVEEQIYILLPLILMLILHNRRNYKRVFTLTLVFIALLSFISFLFPSFLQLLYSLAGKEFASEFSFYSPIDRIWQFMVGGLGFLLLDRYQNRIKKALAGLHTILIIAIILLLFGPISSNAKVGSVIATLISVVIIIAKSLDTLPNFIIQKFEWLGYRSYSIYLFHMPLIYVAKHSPVMQIGASENRQFQSVIAVLASVILGAASYAKVENRFRNTGKIELIKLKRLLPILTFTFLLPIILFFTLDRSTIGFRVDSNFPIASKPPPWDWDTNCEVMRSNTEIGKPCVYGNHKSTKSILLIGDSHAASNSQAVIAIARTQNVKVSVFTRRSCPFIINTKSFNNDYALPSLNPACLEHNKAVLNYVNSLRPDIIILSMRSSSEYIFPNTDLSRILYNKTILSNISNVKDSKSKVILIGAEPEYNSIETWVGKISGAKGSYSKIPLADSNFWDNVSLANFYYMNTVELFCPRGECKNKMGSIWLFNDEHHLSKEGAGMLVPELGSVVDKILN